MLLGASALALPHSNTCSSISQPKKRSLSLPFLQPPSAKGPENKKKREFSLSQEGVITGEDHEYFKLR